jgi:hypothetical protein
MSMLQLLLLNSFFFFFSLLNPESNLHHNIGIASSQWLKCATRETGSNYEQRRKGREGKGRRK